MDMPSILKNRMVSLFLVFFLLPSCGYHLSGSGDLVPKGATTISIPVFINGTDQPYVDIEITQAVVREFLVDGRLDVANLDSADLALHGRVTAYEETALSYTAESYVQQYRVRLVVDVRLEDRRSKNIIWKEQGVEGIFITDYPITYSPTNTVEITATKTAKEEAIRKASQDLASTLRSRVLEGF
ncbi:MAG TPA: hypothetical protein DCO77_09070 [Nitrospiraceae bacterium]|nr:hypothetical protein [Nitrospiraceae bacterium]